jgi:hypothetical protein
MCRDGPVGRLLQKRCLIPEETPHRGVSTIALRSSAQRRPPGRLSDHPFFAKRVMPYLHTRKIQEDGAAASLRLYRITSANPRAPGGINLG